MDENIDEVWPRMRTTRGASGDDYEQHINEWSQFNFDVISNLWFMVKDYEQTMSEWMRSDHGPSVDDLQPNPTQSGDVETSDVDLVAKLVAESESAYAELELHGDRWIHELRSSEARAFEKLQSEKALSDWCVWKMRSVKSIKRLVSLLNNTQRCVDELDLRHENLFIVLHALIKEKMSGMGVDRQASRRSDIAASLGKLSASLSLLGKISAYVTHASERIPGVQQRMGELQHKDKENDDYSLTPPRATPPLATPPRATPPRATPPPEPERNLFAFYEPRTPELRSLIVDYRWAENRRVDVYSYDWNTIDKVNDARETALAAYRTFTGQYRSRPAEHAGDEPIFDDRYDANDGRLYGRSRELAGGKTATPEQKRISSDLYWRLQDCYEQLNSGFKLLCSYETVLATLRQRRIDDLKNHLGEIRRKTEMSMGNHMTFGAVMDILTDFQKDGYLLVDPDEVAYEHEFYELKWV
jgi:hypothetical protein